MNREEAHLDQCTQEHILQAISYLDSDEWLQLFHQPDPSGINNLRIAVSTVLSAIMGMYSVPQPDPITGLVPCEACEDGGWSWLCTRSAQKAADDIYEVEVESKYCPECGRKLTAPPRPGAIGPDAGEMAPNGDEGATHE